MEGNGRNAYGYPPTQTDLAIGNYPVHTINPRMISTKFVFSQSMDTDFQASQANTPTKIAPSDVYTQNSPLTRDDNSPQAKKRRGRPPGSKNKVKSSQQSAPDAQGAGLSLPEGFLSEIVLDPELFHDTLVEYGILSSHDIASIAPGISQPSIARNQHNANQSLHRTVGQPYPGLPPQADYQGHSSSEAMQFQYSDPEFHSLSPQGQHSPPFHRTAGSAQVQSTNPVEALEPARREQLKSFQQNPGSFPSHDGSTVGIDHMSQTLPYSVNPQVLNSPQRYPPIQHQPVDHHPPSSPQRSQLADLQLNKNPQQDLTSPPQHQPVDNQVGQTSTRAKAGDVHIRSRSNEKKLRSQQAEAATFIPTEGATLNVISPVEPVRAFNMAGRLQPPKMPHRQGCPCHACYIDRPFEYKTTRSGAAFDVFASLVGDVAAAVYMRNEEISYMMSAYAGLPAAEFKAKQQKLVKESLDTDPLKDHEGNLIKSVPLPGMLKAQVDRTVTQRLKGLTSTNPTFTTLPPCVADGTVHIEDEPMDEGEGENEDVGEDKDGDEDDMYGA